MAVRPKEKAMSNRRHIPMDIVEEILLHLPVKSVLRFSSVSKSWRRLISQPRFIQRYGSAAGRERILINPFIGDGSIPHSSCLLSSISLSSISSDQTIQDATKFFCPFLEKPYLVATCEELWCAEVGESLYLWNPSINTYKKLADSSPPFRRGGIGIPNFFYGLGYDCVGDDYKILKLSVSEDDGVVQTSELYSLRKDSWRNIELFPGVDDCSFEGPGVFVSGALHWLDYMRDIIVYFDLTMEMYGEVALPTAATSRTDDSYIAVFAFRRKLCTYLSNYKIYDATLWVMEDYGVDKPWTKLFSICNPDFPSAYYYFESLIPLYLYDNGDILLEMMSRDCNWNMILLYKKGDPTLKEIVVGHANRYMNFPNYIYVESLVSPALY